MFARLSLPFWDGIGPTFFGACGLAFSGFRRSHYRALVSHCGECVEAANAVVQ